MNCLPSPSAVTVIGSVLCSGRFNVLSEPANRIEYKIQEGKKLF
jgi:hypothetical protein